MCELLVQQRGDGGIFTLLGPEVHVGYQLFIRPYYCCI